MDYTKSSGEYKPFKFTFNDGHVIEIIHDVHKYGLSILLIFEEWFEVSNQKTVESFCGYIMTMHKQCLAFPKSNLG